MNWANIDISTGSHERDSRLIEPLTCDALLLEIGCNLKLINETTVKAQFEKDLLSRITEAREVFYLNAKNIVAQARKERATP